MSTPLEQVLRYLRERRPEKRTLVGARRYLSEILSMSPPLANIEIEAIHVGGVAADRVRAKGADPRRTLVYFHGGGYALGSPQDYRPLTGRIAHAFGGTVIVPDYRLAPEHPFPAALNDAILATRAVLADVGDAHRVALAGDSAGGGLALATLIALRDAGEPLPAAAALLSPWVELESQCESMTTRAALDPIVQREGMQIFAQMYLGDRDRKDPRVAPTRANLRGLPPLLIQIGSSEVQHDDAVLFADRLRQGGVPLEFEVWPEMIHVFQMFPALPDAHRALDKIGTFLRKQMT